MHSYDNKMRPQARTASVIFSRIPSRSQSAPTTIDAHAGADRVRNLFVAVKKIAHSMRSYDNKMRPQARTVSAIFSRKPSRDVRGQGGV